MRWYVNDSSLQGQFPDPIAFERILRDLIAARARIGVLRVGLHTTRTLSERFVKHGLTIRRAVQQFGDRDLRRQALSWLDRAGPFLEDDRCAESDDYFECFGIDVTDTGLGEATRRQKSGQEASTFSFGGGTIQFGVTPLLVSHGLAEDVLGSFEIRNVWTVGGLTEAASDAALPAYSWRTLVESARERFPHLWISDSVYLISKLASQPFSASIRDRAIELFRHLNDYMAGRRSDGSEGVSARRVVETFFTGDRALFTSESPSNRDQFRSQLTFPDPEVSGRNIFAPWHGKISHRSFRMHFEWPVPPTQDRLKILYFGPKITAS